MKRIFISFATIMMALSATMPVSANIEGNGYYRVRNYYTERWGSLVDNVGTVDMAANSADLHSLRLVLETDEILSDPGSVVYINSLGGYQYNIAAQGVSVQDLIGYPVNLRSDNTAPDGQSLYRIYGTYQGFTKYIADGNLILDDNYGEATINISDANSNLAKWYILPVDANSDNFFGPVPTVSVNGKLYNPLFTSFAYSPYSEGVKVYYIGRIGFGMAEMIEVTGAVPAGSPVIVECAGQKASDNKVKLETVENALPNNSLSGVYFNYSGGARTNRVAYDPKTMRVLGQCSDGSLGYVTADIDYLPANSSYLVVPEGFSPELKCVTTAEYEANMPVAPEQIFVIGSMNSWNAEDGSYYLLPQDEYTYTGTFSTNSSMESDGNLYFRFFTALGNLDENSIGAFGSENVTVNTESGFIGSFSNGSLNNWVLPSWPGGEISVSLNLQKQSVSISAEANSVSTILQDNGEETIYNLQGVKMNREDVGNGLYIINGKKVMIRK